MKNDKPTKHVPVSRAALRKVHQHILEEGGRALLEAPFIPANLLYLDVDANGEIKRRGLFDGSLDPYFVDPAAYKVYLDYIARLLEPGSMERKAFAAKMGYEPQVIVEIATDLEPIVVRNPLTGQHEQATEKLLFINLHVHEGMVSVSHVVSEGPPRTCYQGVLPDEETLPLTQRNAAAAPTFSPVPKSQLH